MRIDYTAIENSEYTANATCVTYRGNTLYVYSNDGTVDTLEEYDRLGNSWIRSRLQTGETPSGTDICYTVEEAYNFSSPYDFIEPIYHTMAIGSAIIIFVLAVSLIVKPFVRRI